MNKLNATTTDNLDNLTYKEIQAPTDDHLFYGTLRIAVSMRSTCKWGKSDPKYMLLFLASGGAPVTPSKKTWKKSFSENLWFFYGLTLLHIKRFSKNRYVSMGLVSGIILERDSISPHLTITIKQKPEILCID